MDFDDMARATEWNYLTNKDGWFLSPKDGKNIKPDTLVVPPALAELAQRILFSNYEEADDRLSLDEIIDKQIAKLKK